MDTKTGKVKTQIPHSQILAPNFTLKTKFWIYEANLPKKVISGVRKKRERYH